MKCEEIFAALELLEKERGIPQDFMMGKIIQALTAAYKKDHEGVENVIVDVNEEKKDLRMYVQKEIVEEVENPGSQISLEDARAMSAKYQLGGVVNIPVKNVEFGRIAAGNGKQVIIQGLREAEHGMIYDEWGSKEHEILTGTVHRIDPRGTVHLRIGSGSEATEGLMGSNEQVPGEELTEGQLVKVYLVEVRRTTRGPQVMVSRTHPGLVKRLFELEVPEIYDGTVEIRSIAREAGSRTKMAVWSSDENVDPIGACVGPKSNELLARIRTAMRHGSRPGGAAFDKPYKAKGLVIDFDKRLVTVDGESVHLTQVEFKIVSYLARNSGRVITYDSLISHVWGPYADDNNRILRVNMANIRRKLEKNPAEPQFILTEIGVGYRMAEDENQENE